MDEILYVASYKICILYLRRGCENFLRCKADALFSPAVAGRSLCRTGDKHKAHTASTARKRNGGRHKGYAPNRFTHSAMIVLFSIYWLPDATEGTGEPDNKLSEELHLCAPSERANNLDNSTLKYLTYGVRKLYRKFFSENPLTNRNHFCKPMHKTKIR